MRFRNHWLLPCLAAPRDWQARAQYQHMLYSQRSRLTSTVAERHMEMMVMYYVASERTLHAVGKILTKLWAAAVIRASLPAVAHEARLAAVLASWV